MRRYQKWLSVGLLALTPGIALAGPSTSKSAGGTPAAATVQQERSARSAADANQQMAEKIANSLRRASISGYDIDVEYKGGVAKLTGVVSSPSQKQAAEKAALSVKGVTKVSNQLAVSEQPPRGAIQQAAQQRMAGRPQRVQQAGGQQGLEPIQQPAGEVPPAPEAMNHMPPPAAGIPGYGHPGSGASHAVYNQPNFPNYSWPSYAAYPNYAQVNYPSQYSASAWPYIGPFYPYPQVPLGWRKAQLEWDDGYWQLNFRPRTERWWWFLDWRNW